MGRKGLLISLVCALVLVLVAPAAAEAAQTWYVGGANASDSNPCTSASEPCATIGHAVSLASSGDTIQIAAGTYDESVTATDDLNFVGAGSGSTTIDGTNTSDPALWMQDGGSVSGLTIQNDNPGIGGALQAGNNGSGGTVTVDHIVAESAPTAAGTDGVDVTGGTFQMSDSTATSTDTDAALTGACANHVVEDGSGLEVSAGTATVTSSTLSAVEGIALRVHASAVSASVSDSVIESSGIEDAPSNTCDGWDAVEAGSAAPITLTGDTVDNETVSEGDDGQPPADAITLEPVSGVSVTAHNTIFEAAADGDGGYDVDALDGTFTADHSAYLTVNQDGGTATALNTAGNIADDPTLNSDFSLAAGSPEIGAGDPSVLSNGETDADGNSRATSCSGGVSVLNIGALESPAPQCPAAAPSPNPGSNTFAYAGHGGSGADTDGYEQLSVGSGGALSQLSPFEVDSVSSSGGGSLIAGSASQQVYAYEQGNDGKVLQQYDIGSGGQLSAGNQLAPPSGDGFSGAALTDDGGDLFVAVTSGSGTTETITIDRYAVGTSGGLTLSGSSSVLPTGTNYAQIAVDDSGRVYVLADIGSTPTLYDFRVDSDGTLTQEDSLALSAYGTLYVAPNGSEAVVMVEDNNNYDNNSSGTLYPVAVSASGGLAAAASVPSSGKTGNSNLNHPTGLTFSSDSKTVYVANLDEFEGGLDSVEEYGGLIAPFAVGSDGSLTADNTSPTAVENAYYESGVAVSPDGSSLYAPDDYTSGSDNGTVDQFSITSPGVLAAKSPASVATAAPQGALVIDTPPSSSSSSGGFPPPTTVSIPPPAPVKGSGPSGIDGTITDAATRAAVSGDVVTICPKGKLLTSACVDATTDSSGKYSVDVSAGSWFVQVNPPANLFGASAFVTVAAVGRTTQNFALSAPEGVSNGVVFSTPTGTVSSGVPTVSWSQPFSFTTPVGAPGQHAANTTVLVAHMIGVGLQTSSSQGSGFDLSDVLLYGVHYGANGKPTGMTSPVVGEVECDAACSTLDLGAAGPLYGSSGVVLAPGAGGVTLIVTSSPNGSPITLTVKYYYAPPLATGPDPFSDTTVDLGTGTTSLQTGLESEVDSEVDQLNDDPDENSDDAANVDDDQDDASTDVESVDESVHGSANYYDDSDDGDSGDQSSEDNDEDVDDYYPDADDGLSTEDIASLIAGTFTAPDSPLANESGPQVAETDFDAGEILDGAAEYLDDANDAPPDFADSEDAYNSITSAANQYEDTPDGLSQYLADAREALEDSSLSDDDIDETYADVENAAEDQFPNAEKQIDEDDDDANDPDDDPVPSDDGLSLVPGAYPDTLAGMEQLEKDASEYADDNDVQGADLQDLWNAVADYEDQYMPNAEAAQENEADEDDDDDDGDIWWDPSGLVESTSRIPLSGAVVTLTRSTTKRGKQKKVPKGSKIMSPGNRRNPDHTTVDGTFGWDTLPGYYAVKATHADCKGASTSVFKVPPPRANLLLKLRCKKLKRAATKVSVSVLARGKDTEVVRVTVKPKRGHAASGALLGELTLKVSGGSTLTEALNAKGQALVDVYTRTTSSAVKASYAGNGKYAPSSGKS